ncbi:MAG: hypothetical protein WCR30_00915 [Clostridia bacterium]
MTDAKRILFERTSVEEKDTEEAKEKIKKNIFEEMKKYSPEPEVVDKEIVFTELEKTKEKIVEQTQEATVNFETQKDELDKKQDIVLPEKECESDLDISEEFKKDAENLAKTETKPKKSLLFRIKIITVAFIMITSLLGGVSIHNAIEANNLSQAVEIAKEKDFQVKLEKIIIKLTGADNSQEKVESVVTSQPVPLEDVTELKAESNFWSKICDAIVNFFGGGI